MVASYNLIKHVIYHNINCYRRLLDLKYYGDNLKISYRTTERRIFNEKAYTFR